MKRFRSAALLTCNNTGAPLRRGADIVGADPMLVGRCTATVTKAHTGVARRVARRQLDTWPKNGFQVSGSVGAVRIDFRRPLPSLVARWCQQHNSDVRVEPTRLVLDMTLMRAPTGGDTGTHLERSHVRWRVYPHESPVAAPLGGRFLKSPLAIPRKSWRFLAPTRSGSTTPDQHCFVLVRNKPLGSLVAGKVVPFFAGNGTATSGPDRRDFF